MLIAMKMEQNSERCAERCSSNVGNHCSDSTYNYPYSPPLGGESKGEELHSSLPAKNGGDVIPPESRAGGEKSRAGGMTLRQVYGNMPELSHNGGVKGSEVIRWIADTGSLNFEAAMARFGVLRRMSILVFDKDTRKWVGCNAHKSHALKEKCIISRVTKAAKNAGKGALANLEGVIANLEGGMLQIIERLERIERLLENKSGGADKISTPPLADEVAKFGEYF